MNLNYSKRTFGSSNLGIFRNLINILSIYLYIQLMEFEILQICHDKKFCKNADY